MRWYCPENIRKFCKSVRKKEEIGKILEWELLKKVISNQWCTVLWLIELKKIKQPYEPQKINKWGCLSH